MATLLSVQIGQPVSYPAEGEEAKAWRSAIDKRPVQEPVWVGALGLEGDKQSDMRNHGGPWRAVNVYPAEHYDFWRATPALASMTGGAFGENFTTQGLLETDTCVGDVFQVGEVLLTVTQPRGPCYKLNRRWQVPDLMSRAEADGRIGWYLKVLREGRVEAGKAINRVEQPFPNWPISRVWTVYRGGADPDSARELAECPALSDEWRAALRKRLG